MFTHSRSHRFSDIYLIHSTLHWCHNERDGISNHQPSDCLLNCLFRCRSKKTSKLCVTGLCVGNSPVTGEFSAQRASNVENVSILWRQYEGPVNLLPRLGLCLENVSNCFTHWSLGKVLFQRKVLDIMSWLISMTLPLKKHSFWSPLWHVNIGSGKHLAIA